MMGICRRSFAFMKPAVYTFDGKCLKTLYFQVLPFALEEITRQSPRDWPQGWPRNHRFGHPFF